MHVFLSKNVKTFCHNLYALSNLTICLFLFFSFTLFKTPFDQFFTHGIRIAPLLVKMMYHVVKDDIHSRIAMPDVIMTFVYLVELHYLPKLVPMLTQSLVAVSGHSFVTKI